MDTNEHESELEETALSIWIPRHCLVNSPGVSGRAGIDRPHSCGFVSIRGETAWFRLNWLEFNLKKNENQNQRRKTPGTAVNPSNPANDETSAIAGPGRQAGAGRFTLERLLGQGAMGTVWLAEDARLKEKVALKFVPPAVRHDQAALDGLRREAQRSHRLAHPNIIRIHDFNEPPGEEPFISMEFVEGKTLSELRWSEPQKCLSWEKLLPLVKHLCDALVYAHGEGVVHRDLKPANLMLDAKGRLKLADFGLAMVIHESLGRASGHVALGGTPAYMSPQQVAGEAPAPADDVYSLGATLYELLASHPPFFRGDIPYQTLNEPPPPIRERQSEFGIHNPVPPQVAETIMACLEKDPGRRPQRVGEVWGRLEGQPARRGAGLEPAHRKIGVYAGAGALLALVVAVVVLALRHRSETETAPNRNPEQPPSTAATTTNGNQQALLSEDFENFGPPGESKIWDWKKKLVSSPESGSAGKAIVAEDGNHYLQLVNNEQGDRLITSPRLPLPENWAEVLVTFRVRTRNLEASKSHDFSGAKVGLDWLRQEGGARFRIWAAVRR